MKKIFVLLFIFSAAVFAPKSALATIATSTTTNATTTTVAINAKKESKIKTWANKLYARYEKAKGDDNAILAGILGILIGGLGIHRVVLGSKPIIILWYFLLSCLFGLGAILGLIDGILILVNGTEKFDGNDSVFAAFK